MLQGEHPNSDEILHRQNALNARWAQLRDMVDQKRDELERAHRLETFRIDCQVGNGQDTAKLGGPGCPGLQKPYVCEPTNCPFQETVTWIEDKVRILEDTDELTNDLSGVMKLQRRLSMMERDLGAIQAKMDSLQKEAESIEREKPEQARIIRQDIARIHQVWDVLNRKVREQETKLDEAGDLQRFLRDLDHFQVGVPAFSSIRRSHNEWKRKWPHGLYRIHPSTYLEFRHGSRPLSAR